MNNITKEQYEFALARIEELLPLVKDDTPANDRNAVELTVMSDVVISYEKEHFPVRKPSVAELIELSLEEEGMTILNRDGMLSKKWRVQDYGGVIVHSFDREAAEFYDLGPISDRSTANISRP